MAEDSVVDSSGDTISSDALKFYHSAYTEPNKFKPRLRTTTALSTSSALTVSDVETVKHWVFKIDNLSNLEFFGSC